MGDLKGKRILVTGGNGYLGSQLVPALKKTGAIVFVMDKITTGSMNEFIADITDKRAVSLVIKKTEPQIIYHLAATLNRDRDFRYHDEVLRINYSGTVNLLRALQDINYENFIFTSTSEIYGSNTPPFHEEQLPAPASPYSLSKFFAETVIRTFTELYRKNYTILRLFNFIGKKMPEAFFVPQLIHSLKYDTVFKMTKGEQSRDFLYIEDVVNALILSATKDEARNELFNVCSSQSITLKQLATEIQQQLKGNCQIGFGALPYRDNEVWKMVGSNQKIRERLGFKPAYNLKEAISELIKEPHPRPLPQEGGE
jgi:UDP-glucose 4-epimerase